MQRPSPLFLVSLEDVTALRVTGCMVQRPSPLFLVSLDDVTALSVTGA